MDKITRDPVVEQVQRVVDLANTPRARLDDIRTALRHLEAFVTTTERRPRTPGMMTIDEMIKAKIEAIKPRFFGGRG